MPSLPRFSGVLKSWNDERGYGFIQATQGGLDLFVHIRDFPSGTGRPSVGQMLTFEVETRADGKKRAHRVQYPVASRSASRRRHEMAAAWTLPRLLVVPVFAVVYGYIVWRWGFRPLVLVAYLVMSIVAFVAYAIDKSAAVASRSRVPEQTLHLLGLCGGWPGALLAQQILRHKTSKAGFIRSFWFTVALNIAAFVAVHVGWQAFMRRL